MPEGARTLPAPFYTDANYFNRELEALYRAHVDLRRPGRGNRAARSVRAPRGGGRQHHRHASGGRPRARVPQRVPASRHASVHRGIRPVSGQHPVPVSRLDLRARRTAGRRAAHGRGAALPQGGLPAASASAPRSGTGTCSSISISTTARLLRCRSNSPIFRTSSARGAWRICGSAAGSSTTSRPTGS